MSWGRHAALLAAVGPLLAGCASLGAGTPDWVGKPGFSEGPGVRIVPVVPIPPLAGGAGVGGGPRGGRSGQSAPSGPGSTPRPGQPTPSSRRAKRTDPTVLATDLNSPVGLTLLPDGSALVGERSTGRIVRVQPRSGRPVPTVRTLTGLDTRGDGGLLDLALSPNYLEDNLIFAYETTPTDNRVVDFTLDGPVTPVLTGIPKGRTDNVGRIAFGPDGNLYVGTGDAGRPALAAKRSSLAGKVLRITDIGRPARGNPVRSSPVLTRGHHVVDGLCPVPNTSAVLEVESGSGGADEVNYLRSGHDYGWPRDVGRIQPPAAYLPASDGDPGGCAVLGGRLYVTSLDGKALLEAPLNGGSFHLAPGAFQPKLVGRYGRLRTVVAAPDGALWLTTSNRDGHGTPVPDDERVIRVVPASGRGSDGSTL